MTNLPDTTFDNNSHFPHPSSNYIADDRPGDDAHKLRLQAELLLNDNPASQVNEFFRQMAKVGLGRNLTAFLKLN